jgi:hypothetical protein
MSIQENHIFLNLFYNEGLLPELQTNKTAAFDSTVRLIRKLRKNKDFLEQFNKKMKKWIDSGGLVAISDYRGTNCDNKGKKYQENVFPLTLSSPGSERLLLTWGG